VARGKVRIDWETISAYLKQIRVSRGAPPESPATDSVAEVDAEQVRLFRGHASHLFSRLGLGSIANAAWGGLQDSAPRSALLSLHARVKGVTPESWNHRDLVQIWFRWADYVVPRSDVDVFTLGALPREPTYAQAVMNLGAAVAEVMAGEERSPSSVADSFGDIPNPLMIRAASVTGLFHIRWDARMTTLIPAPPPKTEPDEARLELARRFLHWLGPGNARGFARWAGLTRTDAEHTWSKLVPSLHEVSVEGKARSILASDLDALVKAEPFKGVRLIPQGDPYLAADKLVAQPELKIERPELPSPLVNALAAGRVLLDGKLVASWARKENEITIAPWETLGQKTRKLIESEAESLAAPVGKPMKLRWLD
jgi:hypothetical protein